MSPAAGLLLIDKVLPILTATVPRAVKPTGSEDAQELLQDTLATAAAMLDSSERAGKPLIPASIAYYAIQTAKIGRRSTYAGVTDALSPAAQIQRGVVLNSMDESAPIADENNEGLNLHEMLAGPGEDPAQQAGRALDWQDLTRSLGPRDTDILMAVAGQGSRRNVAMKYGVSTQRISQNIREIGDKVRATWGVNSVADVLADPLWLGSLRTRREADVCQAERAAA